MRKKIFSLLLIFLLPSPLCASTLIRGRISNMENGQPLMGAHVLLKEKNMVVVTNVNGEFTFRYVESGIYHLRVSFVGFYEAEKKLKITDQHEIEINFTLVREIRNLDSMVIAASRTERNLSDIPANISMVKKEDIRDCPFITIDDVFNLIPGIYVNRNQGIYSKSASVTMRGMGSSSRVLVLLDGIPVNKADKGFINWNSIMPQEVEKIEIIKGPASALYGGNAMTGVINIITREAEKNPGGEVQLGYGTFNTMSANVSISENNIKDHKGFFWKLHGGSTISDGYNFMKEDLRDSTDVVAGMQQLAAGINIGYRFNKNHHIEISYDRYDDVIDDGKRIYEEESGYNRYPSDFLRLNYSGRINKFNHEFKAFYHLEDYQAQKESLKSSGVYQLLNTYAYRNDMGLLFNLSCLLGTNQRFTWGLDYRNGSVDGEDIYKTSTDMISNSGQLDIMAMFIQDEVSLWKKSILMIAGLRYDDARFHNGAFSIREPTSISDFMNAYQGNTGTGDWSSLSPRLALQFKLNKKINTYVSFGKGFRPPILDDLCRNGAISKGFKLANSDLRPEIIHNYEFGATYHPHPAIEIKTSIFCNTGNDFQYFVGTGDSIYTGGSSLKPVLKRENISKVAIVGFEAEVVWNISKSLNIKLFFDRYDSEITSFESGNDTEKDLIGKELNEFPDFQGFLGADWHFRNWYLHLDYKYTGAQWYDEENTTRVDAYDLWNMKITRIINKKWRCSIAVIDLLNKGYIDRKGLQSPGRFIMGNITYRINKFRMRMASN